MRQPVSCPYLAEVRARWDGELAEARAAAVQAHLPTCPICRQEERALEQLSAALRKGDVDGMFPKSEHERLKSSLIERCARSLSNASQASLPACDHPRPTSRASNRPWLNAVVGLACFAVIAAILLPTFTPAR